MIQVDPNTMTSAMGASTTGAMDASMWGQHGEPAVFLVYGTNATLGALEAVVRPLFAVVATTAGQHRADVDGDGSSLMELRQLSGLTWEQLAQLFGVSRRSLHFWASGKPQNRTNQEKLHAMLAVIRRADRGQASANRAILLKVHEDGTRPFDLLAAGRYDEAAALMGVAPRRARIAPPALPTEILATRGPVLSSATMADGLQDSIHRNPGRRLSVRRIKRPER